MKRWCYWRKRIPFVQQLSATECGAACLAMVLGYFGKAVRVDEIRERFVSPRDGASAEALLDAARSYGLDGVGVSLDIDQLQLLERGAILHWEFRHFVVFDRAYRDAIGIVDPASGRRRVPFETFRRSFTGVALLLEPSRTFQPRKRPSDNVVRLTKEIVRDHGLWAQIICVSLLLQVFGLAMPLMTRTLVDSVVPQSDYSLLSLLVSGVVVIMLFQLWTTALRSMLMLYMRTRLDARMTLRFVEHLFSLPYAFFQRRTTGDLLQRLGASSAVREIITGSVLSGILDGVMVVTYLLILIVASPPLTVLVLILGGVQYLVFRSTRRRRRDLMAEAFLVQARSQSYSMEMLSGVEVLKASGNESKAVEHWGNLFSTELKVALRRGRLETFSDTLTGALRMASSMLILGVGALSVMDRRLTLGEMFGLTSIAGAFLGPLSSIVSMAGRLQLLSTHLERMNDVLSSQPEQECSAVKQPCELLGAITVKNVSFRYGPYSPLVLQGVSLEIQPGQLVALVGRSGSGKSTLARLLVGLYPPTEGTICYDGQDLANLDLRAVRKQLGVVTQVAHLFSQTLRANISLTDPTLPFEVVARAAKIAQIHEDITAMPMQYETLLSDRGASLSGGQQQRLALARALVHDPAILVLDEATSQLDGITEKAIFTSLAELRCTRIIIAHRLSSVAVADKIVVISNGHVVEQGTHENLLASGGAYSDLVAAQLSPARAMSH